MTPGRAASVMRICRCLAVRNVSNTTPRVARGGLVQAAHQAIRRVGQIGAVRGLESSEELGGRTFPVLFPWAKAATARARVSGQRAIRIWASAIPSEGAAAMAH